MGKTYKKLWKMAIEIVDFPINSMVIFDSYVNVYQRVQFISICDAKRYQQVNVAYTLLSTRALLK